MNDNDDPRLGIDTPEREALVAALVLEGLHTGKPLLETLPRFTRRFMAEGLNMLEAKLVAAKILVAASHRRGAVLEERIAVARQQCRDLGIDPP